MRKFFITSMLAAIAFTGFSQKINAIKDEISKSDWTKAKSDIDAFLQNEKNASKAEGWYYKGVIYNEVAKAEDSLHLLNGEDGRMIALQAFQKYQEMEPDNKLMLLEQNVRLFDIYNGYFDAGANAYNKKDFATAFEKFSKAKRTEDYVYSKGFEYGNFKFPETDTSLIQNIALSALQAKMEDSAAVYYSMLADKKIQGEGFLEVYQYLVDYYSKKGDDANRAKYVALGRELYPESGYWCESGLRDVDENDKAALFAKYEELTSGDCATYSLLYNYAAEMFNYCFTQDKKPDDYAARIDKIQSVLDKALQEKNTPEANLLLARTMYNDIYELEDAEQAIRGTKAEDVKKKAELTKKIDQRFEVLGKHAQAAYDALDGKSDLSVGERGNYKISADLLSRYYDHKGDAAKAKQYTDKMKSIN